MWACRWPRQKMRGVTRYLALRCVASNNCVIAQNLTLDIRRTMTSLIIKQPSFQNGKERRGIK